MISKDIYTTEKINLTDLSFNEGQVPGLPKNPRFVRHDNFEALRLSIRESPDFLDMRPPIIYRWQDELVVIAGEMRTRAALAEGIKWVNCKVLPEHTPVEKLKAYAIKDNTSSGEWDIEKIEKDWTDGNDLNKWGVFWYSNIDTTTDEPDFDHSAHSYLTNQNRQIVLMYSKAQHSTVAVRLKEAQAALGAETPGETVKMLIQYYNDNN